jgi:hypothetical protein
MAGKIRAPDGIVKARQAARRKPPAVCIRAIEQQLEFAQGFVEAALRRVNDADLTEDVDDLRSRIVSLRLDSGQLAGQFEDPLH